MADIETLVEKTIDAAIRSFNPDDPESYDHWEAELRRLDERLLDSDPSREHLLASVRAQRIGMAFEVGGVDFVLEHSARYIRDFPASAPSFSFVITLRAKALHAVGNHEKEVGEVLLLVKEPSIQGSELIALLENIARRHPGCLPSDTALGAKVLEAIIALREHGYELPIPTGAIEPQLEQIALHAATELRRRNRARGEELLANSAE